MTTLLDLRTSLRDRLNEPSARFWSNAQLNNWLNEGQKDIARRLEVIQTQSTINVVANQNDYTLNLPIVRVYRIEYTDPNGIIYPLEYRDFNAMDSVGYGWVDVSATGTPMFYTLWGVPPTLQLTLLPKPDLNVPNGLRLYYYSLPAVMVQDTDVVTLPAGWEDLIVDYAEYNALRRNKDARWMEAKQIYEHKLEEMRQLTRRWTDQNVSIEMYRGRHYPFWFLSDD